MQVKWEALVELRTWLAYFLKLWLKEHLLDTHSCASGRDGSLLACRGRKGIRRTRWGRAWENVGFIFWFRPKCLFKFTHLPTWVRACYRGVCVVQVFER